MLSANDAKYSGVLLLAFVVFLLSGCGPQPAPPESPAAEFAAALAPPEVPAISKGSRAREATKEERAKAHVPQAKAIQLARKVFAGAHIEIEKEAVPEARYVRVPNRGEIPAHFEWRVFFVPRDHDGGLRFPFAQIDDQTGTATARLGR